MYLHILISGLKRRVDAVEESTSGLEIYLKDYPRRLDRVIKRWKYKRVRVTDVKMRRTNIHFKKF